MKRFILKVGLFLLIIVLIDKGLGFAFSSLVTHAKGGDNGRNNYICNKTNEDILIFGSSRAIHHYNPTILGDSLHESCYNCGQDGNGIILNYGRLLMIEHRYHPQLIICDVTSSFDLLSDYDDHRYLGLLKPYYHREGISDIFKSVDSTERYKMQSGMYQYNSAFLQIIMDAVHPIQSLGIKGFRPLIGNIDYQPKIDKPSSFEYDSLKLNYFEKFIDEAKGAHLVFVLSPSYNAADSRTFEPIKKMCQQKGIPFLDYSQDKKYLHSRRYFKDAGHLNSEGADEFTKDIAHRLKTEGIR
jgi:hypothetical protein